MVIASFRKKQEAEVWRGKAVVGIKACKGWNRLSQSIKQIGCATPNLQWGLENREREEVMAQQARESTVYLSYSG